jgi:hypothetical protein
MTAATPMTGLRRRPMPGMPSHPDSVQASAEIAVAEPAPPPPLDPSAASRTRRPAAARRAGGERRGRAVDYSATRLANFRLPVDLHDRYRRLVAEVEQQHPRLRRPSLTEVIIALLEEGPSTPDAVAELIRRKRADEHAAEATR